MNGIAPLLAASVLWAFSFGLIKTHLPGIHPAFVGFARLALTLPVFLPLLRIRGLPGAWVWRLLGIGAIQYGVAYSTYLFAYRDLAGHQVALLTIFTPLYVVLLDAEHSRGTRLRALGLAGLAVVGAAIIQHRSASWAGALRGAALLQVANVCFAWGQLAYRKARRERPAMRDREVFGLLYVGAVAVTALTTTLLGGWSAASQLTTTHVGVLLYLGIGASGLGFFLWNKGAVTAGSTTLAVLNNIKIPLAVVVALVVFGEDADLIRLLLGGGLMVLATVLAQRAAKS